MAVIGELLFYRQDRVDLDAVLRHHVTLLRDKVDSLPEQLFSQKTDEEIADQLAASEAIEPLRVDFASAKAQVEEVQVEVHDQFGFERGPIRVPGLRATKTIPFRGDRDLWHLRTNPFNLNPPRGEVRGQSLVIGIEVPAQQADEAKRYIDQAMESLPEYLERQKAQIEAHNARIAANAIPLIQQRRSRLSQASDLLKKLQS
jgi:hypothetical protein